MLDSSGVGDQRRRGAGIVLNIIVLLVAQRPRCVGSGNGHIDDEPVGRGESDGPSLPAPYQWFACRDGFSG